MSTSRSSVRVFALAAIFLGITAGYVRMTMQKPIESFADIVQREGAAGIPNPFVRPGDITVPVGASIVEVGQLQTGAIKVYMVELSDTTTADTFQQLSEDAVYLVRTSATAETVPFDFAFGAAGTGSMPDYFFYKYSDADATQEIANKTAATFAQRFPGPFAASAQAWANEAAHGNALSSFQSTRGITFLPTGNVSTGIRFEPNALYAIIVNESGGAQINLHDTPLCGDAWKAPTEQCDDGNTAANDGCNTSCVIENRYTCAGNPSVCTLHISCGDGVMDNGEQCDFGAENGTPASTCTSACRIKTPIPFGG